MNPTENLYSILAREVYKQRGQFDTKKDLKYTLTLRWDAIIADVLKKLIKSMLNLLLAYTEEPVGCNSY